MDACHAKPFNKGSHNGSMIGNAWREKTTQKNFSSASFSTVTLVTFRAVPSAQTRIWTMNCLYYDPDRNIQVFELTRR